MEDFNKNVAYLEDHDFDEKGNLIAKEIPKNIPVVVFVNAAFCGFCRKAHPAFQQFADLSKGKVCCLSLQADGPRESEQALGKRIRNFVPGFRGFPHYCLYYNGKLVDKEIQGREVEDLIEFAKV